MANPASRKKRRRRPRECMSSKGSSVVLMLKSDSPSIAKLIELGSCTNCTVNFKSPDDGIGKRITIIPATCKASGNTWCLETSSVVTPCIQINDNELVLGEKPKVVPLSV